MEPGTRDLRAQSSCTHAGFLCWEAYLTNKFLPGPLSAVRTSQASWDKCRHEDALSFPRGTKGEHVSSEHLGSRLMGAPRWPRVPGDKSAAPAAGNAPPAAKPVPREAHGCVRGKRLGASFQNQPQSVWYDLDLFIKTTRLVSVKSIAFELLLRYSALAESFMTRLCAGCISQSLASSAIFSFPQRGWRQRGLSTCLLNSDFHC